MVSPAQQFDFADSSQANLPGLFFSSRYASLSAAATDAFGGNGILVIDQDWSTGSITIDCDVMAGGGILTVGVNDTVTLTGRVIGDSQIFDVVTNWQGDPTLSGGTPLHPFPVILTQCTNVNAAWFGVCTAGDGDPMRVALQAAFCAVGYSTVDPYGTTIRIPAGRTYVFGRNMLYDHTGAALPYGILIPEHRTITVEAEGATFDYQGSEPDVEDGGDGTCAFAWYSNQNPNSLYVFSGLEWRGGLALPSDVGTNSDFMWLNSRGSRLAIRGLQIGQMSTEDEVTGHRHGIVQCQWGSGQTLTGQRILIDNCDVAKCTDTAVVVVECDALLVNSCRIRANSGSGIEMGCSGLRSFNGVPASGTCSSPKVLGCNFEENVKSGVKCVSTRDAYISSDFESNALTLMNSDANADFSGLYELNAGTADMTNSGGTLVLTGLSFDPTAPGHNWRAGMYVKDTMGRLPVNSVISTAPTSTTITLNTTPPATLSTGIVISAFLGVGDKEGVAEACTWSNSNTTTGNNALNVITQSATVLKSNYHKQNTVQEYCVLHLGYDQPLWATKEIFGSTSANQFSTNCWPGGVVTRESAVTYMLTPSTHILHGTTTTTGFRLTPFFSLDSRAVMVEAGGLVKNAATHGSVYRIQLFDSTGTFIQTLTVGTDVWEEGPYLNQRVGARLAHLTQSTVSGWVSGTTYAIYAMNLSSFDANFDGGVVIRYLPIAPGQ